MLQGEYMELFVCCLALNNNPPRSTDIVFAGIQGLSIQPLLLGIVVFAVLQQVVFFMSNQGGASLPCPTLPPTPNLVDRTSQALRRDAEEIAAARE